MFFPYWLTIQIPLLNDLDLEIAREIFFKSQCQKLATGLAVGFEELESNEEDLTSHLLPTKHQLCDLRPLSLFLGKEKSETPPRGHRRDSMRSRVFTGPRGGGGSPAG